MKTIEWATAALIAVLSVCAGVGAYKLVISGYPTLSAVFVVVTWLLAWLLITIPLDAAKRSANKASQAGSMTNEQVEDALLDLAMKAKDKGVSEDLGNIAFCLMNEHYQRYLRQFLEQVIEDAVNRAEAVDNNGL